MNKYLKIMIAIVTALSITSQVASYAEALEEVEIIEAVIFEVTKVEEVEVVEITEVDERSETLVKFEEVEVEEVIIIEDVLVNEEPLLVDEISEVEILSVARELTVQEEETEIIEELETIEVTVSEEESIVLGNVVLVDDISIDATTEDIKSEESIVELEHGVVLEINELEEVLLIDENHIVDEAIVTVVETTLLHQAEEGERVLYSVEEEVVSESNEESNSLIEIETLEIIEEIEVEKADVSIVETVNMETAKVIETPIIEAVIIEYEIVEIEDFYEYVDISLNYEMLGDEKIILNARYSYVTDLIIDQILVEDSLFGELSLIKNGDEYTAEVSKEIYLVDMALNIDTKGFYELKTIDSKESDEKNPNEEEIDSIIVNDEVYESNDELIILDIVEE